SARARFRGELAAGIRIVRASPRLRVLVAGLVFAVFLVSQGPILQAEAPVGAMGRVSSLTSTVLAASSLLATVVTAQALALIPADAQPAGYPVAIAAAAVVMGGAGLGLVASGLSRGRGPAAAAS
ncbi:MFS transporter, partial [Clavibacter nebraskensis]